MKQAMDWRSDQTLPSPPQRGWARFLDVGSLRASGLQGASKGEYKVWCQWWYTFLGTVFISFSEGSVNQKKKKKLWTPDWILLLLAVLRMEPRARILLLSCTLALFLASLTIGKALDLERQDLSVLISLISPPGPKESRLTQE
jgi:hypothetical protein